VRVFADYHHGSLYEALLILFEDRFGWEVYRPTGRAWHAAGIWKMTDNPATIQQYLAPPASCGGEDAHVLAGLHYTSRVWAYPKRPHKAVTVEQFHSMSWDFVLSSLPHHEARWSQLAREAKARHIVHVGNIGQQVPWELNPYALVSNSTPIQGRGCRYHMEFSQRDFRYTPITHPRRIVSAVHCLEAHSPKGYAAWRELQSALPEFEFREYGVLCADGPIVAMSEVAAAMRSAGWAFHSKDVGDGYGFTLHQWASCGRPLIGQSAPYRREGCRLAEPLWAGAVDLSEISTGAAAARIRAVTEGAGLLEAESKAMRNRFCVAAPFDAQAAAIRQMLEA
jgi:hypothetical protein